MENPGIMAKLKCTSYKCGYSHGGGNNSFNITMCNDKIIIITPPQNTQLHSIINIYFILDFILQKK